MHSNMFPSATLADVIHRCFLFPSSLSIVSPPPSLLLMNIHPHHPSLDPPFWLSLRADCRATAVPLRCHCAATALPLGYHCAGTAPSGLPLCGCRFADLGAECRQLEAKCRPRDVFHRMRSRLRAVAIFAMFTDVFLHCLRGAGTSYFRHCWKCALACAWRPFFCIRMFEPLRV